MSNFLFDHEVRAVEASRYVLDTAIGCDSVGLMSTCWVMVGP